MPLFLPEHQRRPVIHRCPLGVESPRSSSEPLPLKGEPMNNLARLMQWAELLDDDFLACLVEVAAVLAADQNGLTDPDW